MESNNGALAFDVLIRDSNLNEMLAKDEQRIMQFKDTVESGGNDIVSTFQTIGKTIAGLAVTQMLKSWVMDMIEVRGQFQQLEIAFTTMLGSAEQATSLMGQLTNTAASTPFDLQGIAQGAKQLLAYGEGADTVNDTLVRLGNIASGLSIPLNDLVMLYGTTMVQGRLFTQDVRQFMGRGIPLVDELTKVLGKSATEINAMVTAGQIGFPEVQKVIENLTNEGGMFYGLMEAQSKSLTGQISNLEDAWDMMLNKMGSNMEGILSGGISAAATLVENYDEVLKVVGSLVAIYGTYKVATAAVAIAQGKSTQMAALDNVVLKARTALMGGMVAGEKAQVASKNAVSISMQAYTAELQKCLTLEQQEQLLNGVKAQAIQAQLSQEQLLYLSRLQLNEQSSAYIMAAEAILTSDQRQALAKQNLTTSSLAYSQAVQGAVQAQQAENTATMATLRTEAAALKQKQAVLLQEFRVSQNKIQQTRVQIALATAEGNAEAVAALKQQQHTQLKEHAVIVSNMKAAAEAKEAATQRIATLATQQGALASKTKAAADVAQTATSGLLSTATTFLTAKLKALWATMIANPFTALITLATTAISLFFMFGKKTEDDTNALDEYNNEMATTYANLNAYFAVLKTSDSTHKDYQDSLSAINKLCEEHHVELLKENAALEEQVAKHDELIEKIEELTATKIRQKYADDIVAKNVENQKNAFEALKEAAADASYYEVGYDNVYNPSPGQYDYMQTMVEKSSESIREASDALWQSVITDTTQQVGKMSELTGAAFESQFTAMYQNTLTRVQEATQATDQEMETIAPKIREAMMAVVESERECRQETALLDAQMSAFWDGGHSGQTNEEIDITKMSLEELHTLANQLNGTNVQINCQTYGFENALSLLNAVNQAIGKGQANLNTENGINAELKTLKEQRANAVIGSKEWNSLNSQITTLEGKLPKVGAAASSAARKAQSAKEKVEDVLKSIGQKTVELGLDVEESRIQLERDGFAKRQKELEQQHAKEIARINKEQQELEDLYKKAKKTMPADIAAQYDELRANADALYEIQRSELVSTEIEERKKQYQQYYKWVATYGEVAAQQQYASLMAEGSSYTAWLEAKVQSLLDKANSGQLGEADGNALIAYQSELNQVRGVKSAMDEFTESLNKAKSNAKTLGNYLTELAARKAALQRGEGNLIGEDRSKAIKAIDKEIADTSEQLQKQLLETYKTNAAMRVETEEKYQQEITWLKQHGYTEQAALAEKARVKAIGEIDATRIQATDSWRNLFANAQYLSSGAFDRILQTLRQQVEQIGDVDVRTKLMNQLDGLERQVQGSKNPFKLLVNSIKEYNKAADGSPEKGKKFSQMFESISGSIGFVKEGFDSVVNGLKELGLAGDEMTQEMLGDISNMLAGADQLAKGIATGDPLSIIQGGVSLITSAISLFDSTSRRIRREMKEHEKQLKLLQRTYAQLSWETDNAVGEGYYSSAKKEIENLKQQQRENQELARLEQSKKSKDRDDDKVQEYLSNAEEAARQIKDLEKEITETLVQTNFKDLANEMADSFADAFSNMEDSAKGFDDIWRTTIANAVKNSLKLKLIEPVVNDFTQALADYMGLNNNSVAGFNFAYWKNMLQNAGNSFTEGLEGFEEFFQDVADEAQDKKETLEGQIQGCTEDTASMVAGELTTMRIRQMEMLVVQQSMQSTMRTVDNSIREAVGYLYRITANTGNTNSHLQSITAQLEGIRTTIASDPLRAKGLNQ